MRTPTGVIGAVVMAGLLPWTASAQDRPLVNAVKRQDERAVRTLIKQKVDVNATQLDGATALHWATQTGQTPIVVALLEAGARVDAINDYGVTPLWLAAHNGHAAIANALLEHGAQPDKALPSGETPLMTAARGGQLAIVNSLLAKGAKVDQPENTMGQTALMWAISERHLDVAKRLVEAGANITLPSKGGFTPFMFAARTGDIDTAKFLLSKGADSKEAPKDGMSPLHISVIRGHVPFAKFLLDLGADPNDERPGFTVLHWAAGTFESIFTHEYLFGTDASTQEPEWTVLAGPRTRDIREDLINTLLAKGAKVNARTTKPPPRFGASTFPANYIVGATPFYMAAAVADVPTMKLLLKAGADPKINANDETTALIVAAGITRTDSETVVPEERHLEATQLCLDLGLDVNATNKAGNTALHAAALGGLDKMTQFLVDKGAKINAVNKKGETPTKIADGYEHAGMLYERPSTAKLLRKLGGVPKVE